MNGIRFICDKCGASLTVAHYRCTVEGCTGLMRPDGNGELIARLIEDADFWYQHWARPDSHLVHSDDIERHRKLMSDLKTSLFA